MKGNTKKRKRNIEWLRSASGKQKLYKWMARWAWGVIIR